jgi:hypothetical protein
MSSVAAGRAWSRNGRFVIRAFGLGPALLAVLLLGWLVPAARADTTFVISGTVTSLPGHSPVAGVAVDVLDATTHAEVATATTDFLGRYAMLVPAGTYIVKFQTRVRLQLSRRDD